MLGSEAIFTASGGGGEKIASQRASPAVGFFRFVAISWIMLSIVNYSKSIQLPSNSPINRLPFPSWASGRGCGAGVCST